MDPVEEQKTEEQKTIEAKVRRLLSDKEQRSAAETLLKAWTANYRFVSDQLSRSTLTLLSLVLLFTMLATTNLSETSIFGLKFDRPAVPMLLSYSIAGFVFYRAVALLTFSQLIEAAIRETYFKLYPDWQSDALTDLADHPSFAQIEITLRNIEDRPSFFKKAAQSFLYPTVIAGGIGGLAWFTWAGHALIADSPVPRQWSIGAVVMVTVFVIRAIIVLVQGRLRSAG